MVRARSGVLVVALLGACVYSSCSSESSGNEDEDGPSAGTGDAGKPGKGGSGGDLGGASGSGKGGRAGTSGQTDGGENPGGTGANGGEDPGGAGPTGGTDDTGGTATGGRAGSGGGVAGTGGSSGTSGSAGAGGSGAPSTCGNGRLNAGESCDDNNRMSGDGCSDYCLIEDGFDCQGTPSTCSRTTCGNMTVEAGEGCDDGNLVPFDGCSSECRREPTCATGMPCTSPCGDGIVHGSEECDDGNRRNGDGCSSTCAVEAGFACDPEPCVIQNGVCTVRQPLAVRDFNRSTAVGGHPDFRPGYASTGAITGLVETMLDDAGKPVLSSTATPTHGFMHGAAAFAQWYRNAPPASAPIQRMLVLWDDGGGGFVNRFGASGERWVAYTNATFCSNTDCGACGTAPPGQVCRAPCPAWGSGACFATPVEYDGNPLFFPIDTGSGLLTDLRSEGKVPEQYGYLGWPWETAVATQLGVSSPIPTATAMFPSATHNFDFTTEARFWFVYDANIAQRIAFMGDDDAWVFVNGKLAIDLGGWHVPLGGSTTLSAANSLVQGNLYEVAVFHAERQTEGSSFQLNITGLNSPISRCHAR